MIGAVGDLEHVARLELEGAPGVDRVVPILKPYKLASTRSATASSRCWRSAGARSAASTSR